MIYLANERALFEPNLVYPHDNVGRYIELEGPVIEADEHGPMGENSHLLEDPIGVTVQTEKGAFRGYTIMPVVVGSHARIRLYDWGGGHYPDNRIVSHTGPFPDALERPNRCKTQA